MKNRYTLRVSSDNITQLSENEVFVFGSNQAGRHGKGAAHTALRFGAKHGTAAGIQGNAYGIPTKNSDITRTLKLSSIAKYVDEFVEYAKANPKRVFLVTEIGCGLAGLNPKEVAPLFKACKDMENVYLPRSFWNYI